eukprot:4187400-Pyramimonas_sp.AAC.1
MTRNGRSRRSAFGSKRYPFELRSRWRAGIRSNITEKNMKAQTNSLQRPGTTLKPPEIFAMGSSTSYLLEGAAKPTTAAKNLVSQNNGQISFRYSQNHPKAATLSAWAGRANWALAIVENEYLFYPSDFRPLDAPDNCALSSLRALKLSYSPSYERQSTAPFKMTRTMRIVRHTCLEYQTEFRSLRATGGRV